MKTTRFVIAALLGLTTLPAFAETAQEANVKKLIMPHLGEGAKIDAVTSTPYSGLFEVRIGSDIVYTDAKAQYLFVGHVIDTATNKNYTKARSDTLNRIKFSDLPLDAALKSVKGNGKRVIAIFEDPNCGYCKRFRQTLQDVDNITVYTFMYNILSEDSSVKSKNVWCTADRSKAWDDWMLNGKMPVSADCATPNEKVFALGQKMKVTGTPTIIFDDGSRVAGAIDVKTLEGKFTSIK
jgi:thiol:disulfide interchange protein DsbC